MYRCPKGKRNDTHQTLTKTLSVILLYKRSYFILRTANASQVMVASHTYSHCGVFPSNVCLCKFPFRLIPVYDYTEQSHVFPLGAQFCLTIATHLH